MQVGCTSFGRQLVEPVELSVLILVVIDALGVTAQRETALLVVRVGIGAAPRDGIGRPGMQAGQWRRFQPQHHAVATSPRNDKEGERGLSLVIEQGTWDR